MSLDLHHNYWNLLVIRMSLEELHYNMSLDLHHNNWNLLVFLWLQLKLTRCNEDEKDLKWFLQVAYEKNVLVKRSESTFQCLLCPNEHQENEICHPSPKQADIGDGDKILSNLIYLAYHYVKTNKDFRNIGLDYKKIVAELMALIVSSKGGVQEYSVETCLI